MLTALESLRLWRKARLAKPRCKTKPNTLSSCPLRLRQETQRKRRGSIHPPIEQKPDPIWPHYGRKGQHRRRRFCRTSRGKRQLDGYFKKTLERNRRAPFFRNNSHTSGAYSSPFFCAT